MLAYNSLLAARRPLRHPQRFAKLPDALSNLVCAKQDVAAQLLQDSDLMLAEVMSVPEKFWTCGGQDASDFESDQYRW